MTRHQTMSGVAICGYGRQDTRLCCDDCHMPLAGAIVGPKVDLGISPPNLNDIMLIGDLHQRAIVFNDLNGYVHSPKRRPAIAVPRDLRDNDTSKEGSIAKTNVDRAVYMGRQ